MILRIATGGSPEQIGADTGQAYRRILARLFPRLKKAYQREGLRFSQLVRESQSYLPLVRRQAPELLREMQAFAQAAHLPFVEAFFFSVEEEVVDAHLARMRCSTAALAGAKGSVLLHNEDYTAAFLGTLAVRHIRGPRERLEVIYPATLPGSTVGITASGLAWGEDSLNAGIRRGVPKNYLFGLLRSARTIPAFRAVLAKHHSAQSFSVMLATARERQFIEVSFRGMRTRRAGTPPLTHTNHTVLSDETIAPSAWSLSRAERFRSAIASGQTGLADFRRLMTLPQKGIRQTRANGADGDVTLATVEVSPAERRLVVRDWSAHPAGRQIFHLAH